MQVLVKGSFELLLVKKEEFAAAVKLCEWFYIAVVTINKIIQEWRMAALWLRCQSCCQHLQSAQKHSLICFFPPTATKNTSIPSLINIHVGSHERQ